MERKNAWSQYSAEELSRLEAVNEDYKACLDAGKTERECVRLTIERIEKEGYKNLKEVIEFFNDKQELELVHVDTRKEFYTRQNDFDLDFSDVKGQENVKRFTFAFGETFPK